MKLIALLVFTYAGVFFSANFFYFFILAAFFLFFLFVDVLRLLAKGELPFLEIIGIFFLIEDYLSLALISLIDKSDLSVNTYYYCMIDSEEYLRFSFPAILLFYVGSKFVKLPIIRWRDFAFFLIQDYNLSLFLRFLGLGLLGFLIDFLPAGNYLNYVGHILKLFFVVSLFSFGFGDKKFGYSFYLLAFIAPVGNAIRTGMFGGLLQTLIFCSLLFVAVKNINFKRIKNWMLVVPVVLFLISSSFLQTLKGDYRNSIRENNGGNLEQFRDLSASLENENGFLDFEFYLPILYRLNQGYLVSSVMKRVPSEVPYIGGTTIISGVINSVLPRFLFINKEKGGGTEKIKNYSAIHLEEGTSMNIGILGEFYANFGLFYTQFFLLLFGVVIALSIKILYLLSKGNPPVLFFLICFADVLFGTGSDFGMMFNGMAKVLLVAFLLTRLNFFNTRNFNLKIM